MHLRKNMLANIRLSRTQISKIKEQKGGFLGMLLSTSDASLLENMLAGNEGRIW